MIHFQCCTGQCYCLRKSHSVMCYSQSHSYLLEKIHRQNWLPGRYHFHYCSHPAQ
ncbi:hypothetical protein DPMN_150005 [Dreissena polymorpha]|uniref:Uncharacterized protein n=1 Tax=Dreissena polymorpha TaxID=45954 RepID=A0A9D4FDS7_DREPO|nr:hypothetical protein DPMN_150005 [Dreissena polymorpha]